MEAEAIYTAARPVVTVPAWRASAERLSIPAGGEGRINKLHDAIQLIHPWQGESVTAHRVRTTTYCATHFEGRNLRVALDGPNPQ